MSATRRRPQSSTIDDWLGHPARSGLPMAVQPEPNSPESGGLQPRFVLRRTDFSHAGNDYLDGGWWPQSTDLAAELDQLTADAAARGFRVKRLLYQLDEWTPTPRRLTSDGRQVKLSGYRYQPKHTITLIDDSGYGRVELFVVPADADGDVGARAMQLAGTDRDPQAGVALLTQARQPGS